MKREAVLVVYREIVAGTDGVEIKGKKTAYTAINGNMFSFVDAAGLMCIRLGKDDKAAFEAKHGTRDVIQYGAVMRGYVPVPVALLGDRAALRAVFALSVANARTLRPKPTTKKK